MTTKKIYSNEELSHEDYLAAEGLSSSALKAVFKTPAHYKSYLEDTTDKKSTAMDIGTCCHALILENDTSKFIQGPNTKDKRQKEWKDFVKANPDKIVLNETEFFNVKQAYNSVMNHSKASLFFKNQNGVAEKSFFVKDPVTGLLLKARVDWLIETEKGLIMVDLKTTRSADPSEFDRQSAKLKYNISMAHYKKVIELATGKPVTNIFLVAVEKEPPFGCTVHEMKRSVTSISSRLVDAGLKLIKKCDQKKEYPSYKEEIVNIDEDSKTFWECTKLLERIEEQ